MSASSRRRKIDLFLKINYRRNQELKKFKSKIYLRKGFGKNLRIRSQSDLHNILNIFNFKKGKYLISILKK